MEIRSAAVVCVGTELLLGNILDTNSRYIASRLCETGIPLYRKFTVGDNPERMKETFAQALGCADLVIITGGLGPTRDDLTRETVCELFGVDLIHSDEAEENIRRRLAGRTVSENNLKQAYLPAGAVPFYNSRGTAPGFALSAGGKTVIALPGVPHEMKTMFEEWAIPLLRAQSGCVIVSRNLHVCGIGESRTDELLGELEESRNPTVAPYCKSGETRLRLSARASTEAEAKLLLDGMERKIRVSGVGAHIYYVTENDADAERAAPLAALDRLRREGKTLSFAESITGGLLAKMITDIPGASEHFLGSAVTYATEAKCALLGVREETVAKYGVVSEQSAAEMALGARERFGSDIAASTTGLAQASPDYKGAYTPDGKPIAPGTVCAAVADGDGVRTYTFAFGGGHGREYVRELAAARIFHILSGYTGGFS